MAGLNVLKRAGDSTGPRDPSPLIGIMRSTKAPAPVDFGVKKL